MAKRRRGTARNLVLALLGVVVVALAVVGGFALTGGTGDTVAEDGTTGTSAATPTPSTDAAGGDGSGGDGSGGDGGDGCGVDLGAAAVTDAIAAQPAPSGGGTWSEVPRTGNYDPCATLSTAVVTSTGGSGEPDVVALMFHDGEYLGTEQNKVFDVVSVDRAASGDALLVLDYVTAPACSFCPPPEVAQLRYLYDAGQVVQLRQGP